MTLLFAGLGVLVAGAAFGLLLAPRWSARRRGEPAERPVRKILLPFTGTAISRRALEAAVRLARVENAVIMPVFLAKVPRQLPLDSALPRQCDSGMSMLEAIEQAVLGKGVAVDSRVARGRTYRHALSRLLEQEAFDRVIISATSHPRSGLNGRDLEWLLEDVPSEILILRPAATDEARISAEKVRGHF